MPNLNTLKKVNPDTKPKGEDIKDKVVVIMPNGTIAQFPNYHIAKAMLLKKYHNQIYQSADNIYNSMSHEAIILYLKKLQLKTKGVGVEDSDEPPKADIPLEARADASVAATMLWALMHETADELFVNDKRGRLVKVSRKLNETEVDQDPFALTRYWLLYEPGVDPIHDAAFVKLPPQARACLLVLIDANSDRLKAGKDVVMSEATLFKYIERDQRYIKTRQSKWRIFKYYRSMLIARNFIRMR